MIQSTKMVLILSWMLICVFMKLVEGTKRLSYFFKLAVMSFRYSPTFCTRSWFLCCCISNPLCSSTCYSNFKILVIKVIVGKFSI